MISKAKRYNIKGRKYVGANLKYYFMDVGLRNVRFNFRQQEPTHIMENIVYNELLVRGYNMDVGIVNGVMKPWRNEEGFVIIGMKYFLLNKIGLEFQENVMNIIQKNYMKIYV